MGVRSRKSRRHPGWPAILGPQSCEVGEVVLRPLARRDGTLWRQLRLRDQELIERWDMTSDESWQERHSRAGWVEHRTPLVLAARRGLALPFAITVDGTFAGQVTLGGIVRGAVQSGWVGYWVSSELRGRGIATVAVALAAAHALGPVGLHRVEATIDPANAASRAVAAHIGMREEGLLKRYLNVFGQWRDHLLFAITAEEVAGQGDVINYLLSKYRANRG